MPENIMKCSSFCANLEKGERGSEAYGTCTLKVLQAMVFRLLQTYHMITKKFIESYMGIYMTAFLKLVYSTLVF